MTDEAMSPLRRRMIEDMTICKFVPKIQHDYVQGIKNFAAFLGRSPDTASFEDVRRYQLHLAANPDHAHAGDEEQCAPHRIRRSRRAGSSRSIAPGTMSLITHAPWLPPTTSKAERFACSRGRVRHGRSRKDRRPHRRAHGGVGVPTINQTVSTLRCFFKVTLGRPKIVEHTHAIHEPRKLPVVLSPDEVVRLLDAAPGLKYKAALERGLRRRSTRQ